MASFLNILSFKNNTLSLQSISGRFWEAIFSDQFQYRFSYLRKTWEIIIRLSSRKWPKGRQPEENGIVRLTLGTLLGRTLWDGVTWKALWTEKSGTLWSKMMYPHFQHVKKSPLQLLHDDHAKVHVERVSQTCFV